MNEEQTLEEFLLYQSGLLQGWANRLVKEGSEAIPEVVKHMEQRSRLIRSLVERGFN